MAHNTSGPNFLAFDFGTSHLRAAVGKATGAPVAIANRSVNYYKPDGSPDAALEFDAAQVWNLAVEAANEAIHSSKVTAASVKAVGVTSQRHGMVLLDAGGNELYAGPNKDLRAAFQGGVVDDAAGDALWDLTGHGPGFLTWWARLLWMKEEAPQLFERIRSACGIADWLAYRLTGELTIDSALAVDSGVGALTTGQPAEAIAEKLGIDVSIFPPVSRSGCVVGTMSKVAAEQLGLARGRSGSQSRSRTRRRPWSGWAFQNQVTQGSQPGGAPRSSVSLNNRRSIRPAPCGPADTSYTIDGLSKAIRESWAAPTTG